MIDAIAVSPHKVKVIISGSHAEQKADWERFRNDVPSKHRKYYAAFNHTMVVRAHELDVPYIKRALNQFNKQAQMF
jgi:iron uptake system EfeUOB component EfeO/EfeM